MSTNTAENKAAAVIAYAFPWPGWVMTNNYTHQTAPTQFVEAAGICFAYRRFGVRVDIPLLFFMHFTGTMDHWDPGDLWRTTVNPTVESKQKGVEPYESGHYSWRNISRL